MSRYGRLIIDPGGAVRAYPEFLANGSGACATHPTPDDFTEESTRLDGRAARERAKKVCAPCPHIMECFGWALDTSQDGVYGGTDTKEREKMRALPWLEHVHRERLVVLDAA
jgi:hypothetical protein